MFRKLIHRLFGEQRLKRINPDVRGRFPVLNEQDVEHKHNMEAYAAATFELQKDALQKNLSLMYRTVIFSFLAILISFAALIFTTTYKQPVIVNPTPVQVVK